jgi:uncharacterized protein YkwD
MSAVTSVDEPSGGRLARRGVAVSLSLLVLSCLCGCSAAATGAGFPVVDRASGPPAELSEVEAAIVAEINRVRAAPASYADELVDLRPRFAGLRYRASEILQIDTQEGVVALDDAVRALRLAAPAPPLRPLRGLCRAALEHAADQTGSGAFGHVGSDGSTFGDRVSRHGRWTGTIAENITYGAADAASVVRQLIVDDGVPSRGHRVSTLKPVYRVVGVACAPHPVMQQVCVIEMAAGFEEGAGSAPDVWRQP